MFVDCVAAMRVSVLSVYKWRLPVHALCRHCRYLVLPSTSLTPSLLILSMLVQYYIVLRHASPCAGADTETCTDVLQKPVLVLVLYGYTRTCTRYSILVLLV